MHLQIHAAPNGNSCFSSGGATSGELQIVERERGSGGDETMRQEVDEWTTYLVCPSYFSSESEAISHAVIYRGQIA